MANCVMELRRSTPEGESSAKFSNVSRDKLQRGLANLKLAGNREVSQSDTANRSEQGPEYRYYAPVDTQTHTESYFYLAYFSYGRACFHQPLFSYWHFSPRIGANFGLRIHFCL